MQSKTASLTSWVFYVEIKVLLDNQNLLKHVPNLDYFILSCFNISIEGKVSLLQEIPLVRILFFWIIARTSKQFLVIATLIWLLYVSNFFMHLAKACFQWKRYPIIFALKSWLRNMLIIAILKLQYTVKDFNLKLEAKIIQWVVS